MVLVRSESGVFHALNAATGSPVWSWENTDSALRSPTVVNGFLIAESKDGNLRALVAATGDEVWSFSKGYFDGVPSYTIADGMLYVGTLNDNSVYAFAIASAG
jgi:outer membrane protein assembly factor BamB